MRATIDWSYHLLSPVEQILFARLSVFAGSFALESAEGVCHRLSHPETGEPSTFRLPPPLTMLDIVQSLVDHSLLRQVPDAPADEPRYRMLQAIREYGLLRLEEHAEAGKVRAAHAHHFVDLAERSAPGIGDAGYESVLDRLDRDYPNVVDALTFTGATPLGLRLAEAMGRYWAARGLYREGRLWLERSLGDTDPVPPTHERLLALRSAGWQARLQGDTGAALRLQTRALQGARLIDDPVNMVGALQELALVHMHTGQNEVAVREMRKALSLPLQMEGASEDGPQVVSVVQANVAQVTLASGDPATALLHAEDAIVRQRALGYHWALCDTLRIHGDILLEQGHLDRALASYQEAIDISRDQGDVRFLANALAGIARISALGGDAPRSARLYAAAGLRHEQIGAGIEVWQRTRHDDAISRVQRALTPAEFARQWESGRSRSLDETIAEAMSKTRTTLADPSSVGPLSKLSAREIDVLRLLTQGLSDRDIGEALSISPRTASYHVTNLLTKLDLESRTAAAAFAIRHGVG
jgi:DNA-binding CsgD family transcriptional regulator/tetratricopeptide (TPR) repeat protein